MLWHSSERPSAPIGFVKGMEGPLTVQSCCVCVPVPYNLVSITGCSFVPTAFNPVMKPRECDEVEETRRTRDRDGRAQPSEVVWWQQKDFSSSSFSFFSFFFFDLETGGNNRTRGEKWRRTKLDGAEDIYVSPSWPCREKDEKTLLSSSVEIHLVDVC